MQEAAEQAQMDEEYESAKKVRAMSSLPKGARCHARGRAMSSLPKGARCHARGRAMSPPGARDLA
jgi:hypothetical protein